MTSRAQLVDGGGVRFRRAAVIGGGAWGTALAALLARNGVPTRIWARESDVAAAINERRENTQFLPGVALPDTLEASDNLSEAARGAEAFIFVAPAQHARAIGVSLKAEAPDEAAILLCAKGIEQATGQLLTEVFGEIWPRARLAALSGPSFARDVAIGLPTAVTLACPDEKLGARWIASLSAPNFRPYLSDDLIGAELGGAVKNVLAIAAGAVDGKGLGESARAAIIARGFAEFQRLGVALGARAETMAGLSGLGDLILTATSTQSRNMSLGHALGAGAAAAEVLEARNSVAEGAATAPALVAIAKKASVDMPICAAVADLVSGARGIDDVIADLMSRPLRPESR
jgi:glycerol-3-phosphate dehydrogenase (NAD(P)+)